MSFGLGSDTVLRHRGDDDAKERVCVFVERERERERCIYIYMVRLIEDQGGRKEWVKWVWKWGNI